MDTLARHGHDIYHAPFLLEHVAGRDSALETICARAEQEQNQRENKQEPEHRADLDDGGARVPLQYVADAEQDGQHQLRDEGEPIVRDANQACDAGHGHVAGGEITGDEP